MESSVLAIVMVLISCAIYFIAYKRSLFLSSNSRLDSLPIYYGLSALIWVALPAFSILALWFVFEPQIIKSAVLEALPPEIVEDNANAELILNLVYNIAYGDHIGESPIFVFDAANRLRELEALSAKVKTAFLLFFMGIGALLIWFKFKPGFKARVLVEQVFQLLILACACIAIFTTIGIVLSVIAESTRFFNLVSPIDFLFGTQWNPQDASPSGEVNADAFGAVPLLVGTLYIAAIALAVAVPLGLLTAIYLSEYASPRIRANVKPLVEILAGIPTVVYGFFAAITVAPLIRDTALFLGLDGLMTVTSESILAVGLVMGVMIIPFVSSLADDVINAVPNALREASLALGATPSETITKVVFPAALPGIVGGILLAASRAIGETMIVVMAAGLAAKLTANPLDSMTTVTVQIVTLLVGDQEFDSPKTLSAFALGLMLFAITLTLNFLALHVVKKYREQYD